VLSETTLALVPELHPASDALYARLGTAPKDLLQQFDDRKHRQPGPAMEAITILGSKKAARDKLTADLHTDPPVAAVMVFPPLPKDAAISARITRAPIPPDDAWSMGVVTPITVGSHLMVGGSQPCRTSSMQVAGVDDGEDNPVGHA
jgi:hypothetical protein